MQTESPSIHISAKVPKAAVCLELLVEVAAVSILQPNIATLRLLLFLASMGCKVTFVVFYHSYNSIHHLPKL